MSAPHKFIDNEKLKDLISKNVFFSGASEVFYLLTRLALPPLTLSMVSLAEYGIWASCFVVISFMGMGVSGISQTYIRYVGIFNDRHDVSSIGKLLSTGLTLSSMASAVFLLGLWFFIPFLINEFEVPDHLYDTAFILFFGTAVIFTIELSWGSLCYVLTGLQNIVAERTIWILAFTLEAVLIVIFLFHGLGIFALMWAFGLRYLFSISAHVFMAFRLLPGLKLRPGRIEKRFVRTILRFGGVTQSVGIFNMIMGAIDKVLAGFFLNISAVSLFDLGQKFPRMAINIPSSFSYTVFPATTHLQKDKRHGEIAELYLRGSRYINLMAGVMLGYMASFSLPLITAWLGDVESLSHIAAIMMIFTVPWQWHTTTGPATAVFKGLGTPIREGVYPLARGVVLVAAMTAAYLVAGWTIMSIGYAAALSILLGSLFYMLYANSKLNISQFLFIKRVIFPGLVAYGVAFGLRLVSGPLLEPVFDNRWKVVIVLGGIGVLHTLICGLLIFFVILDPKERQHFGKQIDRLKRKFGLE